MKGSGYRGLSRTVLGRQTTEPTNGAAAGLSGPDGLGKPTIKFEFNNNDELKKFLQENENLIESEVVDAEIVDESAPDYKRRQLQGYGDTYEVLDQRKRSKKEPGEVKALSTKNLVIKLKEKAPENYIGEEFKTKNFEEDGFKIFYYEGPDGKFYLDKTVDYFQNYTSDNVAMREGDKITFKNKLRVNYKQFVKTEKDDYLYLSFNITAPFVNLRSVQIGLRHSWIFYYPLDLYCLAVVKDCENVLAKNNKTSFAYKVANKVRSAYYHLWQSLYPDAAKTLVLSALDGSRDPDLYNYDLSQLYCKGLKPTYKPLKDYGRLICKKSTKENIYLGDGFNVTESLLIQKVIENYKTVAPLAEHLKADTPRQSAFNVWYWLQENVRYNYDAPGKEEIRSPARTWADRQSGVDCDCLAVFTYCLLLSMGYNPKFEIVAFDGKPNCWAHIYVNLNGMAVDRVMRIFDERPALIAKTKMLEVPVYSLEGLSGLENELSGLESLVLQKINNGTATASDCCCWRKANALRRLTNNPVEQKTFSMFMPYIYDVDMMTGDIIFLRQYSAMAALMRWADEQLMQLAAKYGSLPLVGSEEYNSELGSIWGTIKSWGKSIGNAIVAPVKAVYQITKSATKATVNAVKASANLIAAGAQAVTGHSDKAKELMQKVLSQTKAAVITPLKDAVDITKDQVKDTIIEPTKTSIELVKVVLVKLNPITVLMRNAWRALIAINFVGMASRIGVGMLSESEAAKYDVVGDEYATAKKAYDRSRKFFTAMGGDGAKFDSTVKKAMFRKPLFSGDYKLEQQITENDELAGLSAGLGEGVTIGSCLAAVGAFFAKIWAWIKDIIPKVVDWVKEHKEVIEIAKSFITKDGGGGSGNSSGDNGVDPIDDGNSDGNSKQKKAITTALIAAGGVGLVYLATKGNGKKKKRRGK